MSKKMFLLSKAQQGTSSHIQYDPNSTTSYSGSGSILFDIKGNNNSNLINSPTFNNVSPNNFSFNGTNQSTISDYSIIANQQISVSIWFKSIRSGVFETVINSSVSGSTVGITIQKREGGNYWASIGTWGVDSTIFIFSTVNDVWVNITLTYDNELLKCYKNGVLLGSVPYLPGRRYLSANKIIMGKGALGAGEHYKGNIGEVEIWNTSIVSAEVLTDFNNKKSKYGL